MPSKIEDGTSPLNGACPLLRVEGITKEFSGVGILNGVSFDLHAGEVLGLIGENGAGKSTLIKIIAGIYTPTSGKIILNGREVSVLNAADGKELGITVIPQEFNLVKDLNVFENIFLGKEIRSGLLLNKKKMASLAAELLQWLCHADISPYEKIENLSVAQKQMVEFAKALSTESKILIMDEPTTVLTQDETQMLFKIIENLKQRGVALIYISHKLREIKTICDRVVVLRDGNFISDDPTEKLTEHEMATRMVGRELSQIFPDKLQCGNESVLDVEGLEINGLLHDVSFSLKKGEILGFAGLVGAGRTEVAETLIGLRDKSRGKVFVKGKPVRIKSPSDALAHGLSYLSEDRQGKGILVKFGIAHNVSLMSLAKYCSCGLINRGEEARVSEKYVEDFGIKAASLYTNLEYFSGGNQQKVSLSKSLDTHPEILIIDEPTRGIDVNAKREIYHFINGLVRNGLSCIVISSELEEIIGLCNRVVVMHSGHVRGILEGGDINEENIMLYATGLKG